MARVSAHLPGEELGIALRQPHAPQPRLLESSAREAAVLRVHWRSGIGLKPARAHLITALGATRSCQREGLHATADPGRRSSRWRRVAAQRPHWCYWPPAPRAQGPLPISRTGLACQEPRGGGCSRSHPQTLPQCPQRRQQVQALSLSCRCAAPALMTACARRALAGWRPSGRRRRHPR